MKHLRSFAHIEPIAVCRVDERNQEMREMGPATSAVMILLSCSPDMLFCRPAEPQPRAYADVLNCQQALRDRLASERDEAGIMVGKCQIVSEVTNVATWNITPDRRLITFEAPSDIEPAHRVGPSANTSVPAASVLDNLATPEYATVRVTRGTGAAATTTLYRVPHSD